MHNNENITIILKCIIIVWTSVKINGVCRPQNEFEKIMQWQEVLWHIRMWCIVCTVYIYVYIVQCVMHT
jgi:hypothetical protein